MIKKSMALVALVALMALVMAVPAWAAPGGQPAAHDLTGKEFGVAVSALAKSAPGAVAAHVSNAGGNGGGMPAAHDLTGQEFGAAVSALAHMYPGAVADHVAGH